MFPVLDSSTKFIVHHCDDFPLGKFTEARISCLQRIYLLFEFKVGLEGKTRSYQDLAYNKGRMAKTGC